MLLTCPYVMIVPFIAFLASVIKDEFHNYNYKVILDC